MKRVENLSSLEIPPTIKLNMKQLQINVYKGKDIVALDENFFSKNSCDPYVSFSFGSLAAKTRTVKKNLNPGRIAGLTVRVLPNHSLASG